MINFLTLNGFNTLFVKPKTFRSKFASESVNKETEQTMTGNISFEILRGLVGLSHRLRCIHVRARARVCVSVCVTVMVVTVFPTLPVPHSSCVFTEYRWPCDRVTLT